MTGLRRRRWMAGCAAVTATLGWGLVAPPAAAAAEDPVDVVVDGLDVHKDNVNGLPYKGLGLTQREQHEQPADGLQGGASRAVLAAHPT